MAKRRTSKPIGSLVWIDWRGNVVACPNVLSQIQAEERIHILRQAEAEGLDVGALAAMSFRDLTQVWSDWQSDNAMMNGTSI